MNKRQIYEIDKICNGNQAIEFIVSAAVADRKTKAGYMPVTQMMLELGVGHKYWKIICEVYGPDFLEKENIFYRFMGRNQEADHRVNFVNVASTHLLYGFLRWYRLNRAQVLFKCKKYGQCKSEELFSFALKAVRDGAAGFMFFNIMRESTQEALSIQSRASAELFGALKH